MVAAMDWARAQIVETTTFREKHKMLIRLFQYGGAVSLVSNPIVGYQILRLYARPLTTDLALVSFRIWPTQTLLKAAQVATCLPLSEIGSPPLMFAAMGVLQGGVYGQAVLSFTKRWSLTSTPPRLRGLFRGSLFAAGRDSISQGLPWMVRIPLPPTSLGPSTHSKCEVALTAGVATLLSQGLHNAQSVMQADQRLSHRDALVLLWKKHRLGGFFKGFEARIVLVVFVNLLNVQFLSL